MRSNVGATSQTGEPIASAPGNTMWYSWTAPSAGRLNVGTCNQTSGTTTTFDTWIRVFTGNTVTTLTSLVSNDDTAGCATDAAPTYGSTGSIAVTAGTVYRIQVDGYGSATGTFLLHYGLAAIVVATTDGFATEGGDTGAFTVRLNSVPTANVTVTIGASGQCSFSPTSLTFTPTNWATAQTVTVTATNDGAAEGTHSCSPASITASATGGYNGVPGTPPTITIMDNDVASFSIAKAQTSGSNPVTAAGQTIGYTITVANTSGTILTGLTISDALLQAGSPRTLTSGPTYASGDADSDGQIDVYETWTYSASYTATQSDIDNGGTFSNTATFDTAQTAPSTSAAVTTAVTQSPSFTVVKAQTSGASPLTAAGQTIGYTITVDNTGNLTLTGLSVSDALLQAGSPRTLTSGPTYASGDADSDGAIDTTEVWTYSASYTATQSDIDNGGTFSNTATFDTAQTAPRPRLR
ncbi:MAG: hypothetical protein IPL47_16360 [Phyllobacteriaceae bacterium]|nr:hypothetical protein [Phyllobacteriaceae bacterium]